VGAVGAGLRPFVADLMKSVALSERSMRSDVFLQGTQPVVAQNARIIGDLGRWL
jgi:hypothetical protein